MKLRVVAVGKLKEPHWRSAFGEYVKRLNAYATVEVVEVPDRDISSGAERAKAAEGADLLRAVPAGSHMVLLDVGGRELTSEDLAGHLQDLMLRGRSDLTFVVGGSAGVCVDVRARGDERLSLSKMTLPHELARVVLAEQLYRAFKIMRNEPYHL